MKYGRMTPGGRELSSVLVVFSLELVTKSDELGVCDPSPTVTIQVDFSFDCLIQAMEANCRQQDHEERPGMTEPHFEYRIRESVRAKYMSLRVTVDRGLEVVVPRGFDRKLIPIFLRDKHDWVQSALSKVDQARQRRVPPTQTLPMTVSFPACDRSWTVQYLPRQSGTITLFDDGLGGLRISGAVDNIAACHSVLQRWTRRQAFNVLNPLLRKLSVETGIAFVKTAIRCQKSRWGSCSSSGTISLNQKLLFVAPDLVRYVLIHELCHMRQMNHSRHFWKLVGQYYPDYRRARQRLKEAWYQMPDWAG